MTKRSKIVVDNDMKAEFEQYVDKIRSEINDSRIASFNLPILGDITPFVRMVEQQKQIKGKMLRPLLCVMISDALNGDHQMARMFGTSIEQVHNGTLVHDDILDGDITRRGQPTAHMQFGIKPAILLGDLLNVAGLGMLATVPPMQFGQATYELVEAIGRMAKGASTEEDKIINDEKQYLEIARLKTATAYRSAGRLAAIASGLSPQMKEIVSQYAESIGMAFQVSDDLVDIINSRDENTPFGDVKDGKLTAPIIHIINKYDIKHEATIYKNGVSDMDDISTIAKHLDEAIEYGYKLIREYIKDAISNTSLIITREPYGSYLKIFPEYAVNSMLSEANVSITL